MQVDLAGGQSREQILMLKSSIDTHFSQENNFASIHFCQLKITIRSEWDICYLRLLLPQSIDCVHSFSY